MRKDKVVGIATEVGGRTSHTAIMARALEIPAVVGLDHLLLKVKTGDPIIVDGLRGKLVIEPTPELFKEYLDRAQRYHYFESQLMRLKDLPAVTTDGYRIELAANIELIDEVAALREFGATSIGLYRTEFLYLNRVTLPTEQEHYEAYRAVAEKIAPAPAVIRTFDLGGDKFLSNLGLDQNIHSSLGLRAIRLCLKEQQLFRIQLRGILRASVHGNLKIMFPMISNLGEFRQAKQIVHEVYDELHAAGVPVAENIEIGLMIEVPSAAIIADALAREADFFSVGTNDLIQYALAIDRVNEEVAYLYEPLHPAVLRMAKYVVEVGHREGIWVGVCGEMAADPATALLLVGLGFDELSMNPVAIPRVKKVIRAFSFKEAVEMAEEVVNYATADEAKAYLEAKLAERFPDGLY
jgi:phosphotransferase system enzyme I (PtsI)